MTEPEADEIVEEIGHSDRVGDLDTPPDDDQVEPDAQPWVEDEDDPES